MPPRIPYRHPYARVFWLTLALTAIAYGAAFLPAYSIDDYRLTLRDVPRSYLPTLRQGRFGQAALIELLHRLQLEPQYARVFFFAFALAVSAFLATLVVRYWRIRPTGWLALAAAGMISIHPFGSEIFTFRTALGTCMCAFALLAVVLLPRRWSVARFLGAAAAFAAALSIYQVVLHYALMIVLLGIAIGLTRLLVALGRTPPRRLGRLLSWRGMLRSRNALLFACFVTGFAGYVLTNALVMRALQVPTISRTRPLALAGVGERLQAVLQVLEARFVAPDAFLEQSAKELLALLLASALSGVVAQVWRRPRWRAVLLGLAVVGVLALALVWTLGVLLVLEEFWPVARAMSHVGVFWAGILVIAYHCLRRLWPRRLLGALSVLVLLAFVGGGNRVLHEQIRINARDAAKASRILERLEALPGFTGREAVEFRGHDWGYAHGHRAQDHDMNISAFGATKAQVEILREISGYVFQDVPEATRPAVDAYCAKVLPWPGPESVAVQDGAIVVCLESD